MKLILANKDEIIGNEANITANKIVSEDSDIETTLLFIIENPSVSVEEISAKLIPDNLSEIIFSSKTKNATYTNVLLKSITENICDEFNTIYITFLLN